MDKKDLFFKDLKELLSKYDVELIEPLADCCREKDGTYKATGNVRGQIASLAIITDDSYANLDLWLFNFIRHISKKNMYKNHIPKYNLDMKKYMNKIIKKGSTDPNWEKIGNYISGWWL